MSLCRVLLAIAWASLPAAAISSQPAKGIAAIEQAVLAEAGRNWDAAQEADVTAMMAPLLSTEKGAYVAQSEVWWTRDDTVAFYAVAFENVARQELDWERETVTVLSPTAALYLGKGVYRQYDRENQLLIESPHAVTIIFVLVDGHWRIRHLHQSFPG